MRTVLLVALLLAAAGTATVATPTASAHTCDFFNVPCLAVCIAHSLVWDHPCFVYAPDWPWDPLP